LFFGAGLEIKKFRVICLYRFGDSAAKVAEETLATAGHVVATAWTVTKLRKALNPKASPAAGASKLTKTGFLKAAAKNTLKGGKK
jgi:spartin